MPNEWGDEEVSTQPATRANAWGDPEVRANVLELPAGAELPRNEWGDVATPDAVVRVPPADTPASALLAPPPSRGQSTTAGGTTGLGAGMLRQDLPGLREIYGTVAEPLAEAMDVAPIPITPDEVIEAGLRAAPPVLAAVAATPLTPAGQAAAFGVGMGVGDTLAQGYRILRGQQAGFELAPTVTQTALGLGGAAVAPLMPIAQPAAPTARAFVQSLARPLAAEAATAATISGVAQLATEGEITPERTAWDTLLGTGAGMAFNAAMAGQATAAMRQGLYERARSMGWKGDGWADLRDWVRSETATRVRPGAADAAAPGAAPASALLDAATGAPVPPAARPPAAPEAPAPAAPGIDAAQWRALSRSERVGSLARLSDEQLDSLATQVGARPPAGAASAAAAPGLPAKANEWGDVPAETPAAASPAPAAAPADAPPAASLEELARMWADTGVGLRFGAPAKSGEIEVSLDLPEAQRGQGIGAVVLGEVQEMADFLRVPVSVRLPKGEEVPKGFERVGGGDKLRYTPGTITRAPGSRPRFGPREDGVHDLLDDIAQVGGVPRPPEGARGGEWDGWAETFGSAATRLLVKKGRGAIDQHIAELNEGFGYKFDSPDDYFAAVSLAVEGRRRAKARMELEQNQTKFYEAALENKGRRAGGVDEPVSTDTLATGDRFKVRGDDFVVEDVLEDGRVVAKDGPDVGTVELPPGSLLHPDKGSLVRGDAGEQAVNEWGDLAEAMPARDSAANVDAGRGGMKAEAMATGNGAAQQSSGSPQSGPDLERLPVGEYETQVRAIADAKRQQVIAAMARSSGVRGTFGADLDNSHAADQILNEIAIPRGLRRDGFNRTKWGSYYMTLADPETGESWKLAVKDHEQTRGDMGKPDFRVIIASKDWKPQDVARATRRIEDWIWSNIGDAAPENNNTPLSGGAEGIKTIETPRGLGSTEPSPAPSASPNSARTASGASASPGSRSAEAYPGAQDRAPEAAPADDPTFTQLPIELPELVQFYRALSGGQYPRIREKLRVLKGEALGVFYHRDGPEGVGKIELKADIFRLVSEAQRNQLLADAITWARMARGNGAAASLEELTAAKFNELVKAAEQKALTEHPRQALAVLAHEIGHFADWLPDKSLKRGNLLGHLVAFKRHFKSFAAERPGMDPAPTAPTPREVDKLRRQAERELREQVSEIVETIRREEPVYREFPITPENITSILKDAQRDEFPGLYDWFAGLERAEKAAVLRAAMKGAVDPRAAQFSRREPTGETRTVEETVRRQVNRQPTKEEIHARFDELLRAELRARGLISEKEIRAEADTVLKWWQGVDEVPAYFKTASETYAELFSAIINNPAGVAKRAPTLWRAWNAYLENRPEVAAIYRGFQDSIRSGAIHRERVLNLRDMWHRDEDNSLLADSMFQAMDGAALRDTLSVLFNRQTGPIQRRALAVLKRDKNDKVAAAALSGLKNYLYRATGWEAFARDLNLKVEAPLARAGLHHDDMSEYLFHSRIAAGDRQQLANPLGWSPKTSAERLTELEAQLGPERWAALQEAAVSFRGIYESQVLPLLRESQMLTPELMQIIEDRTLYATFSKAREFNPLEAGTLQGALENRYGKDVTARIYRQIGTLGEIRSPYLATVQKAFSLISTARRQIGIDSVVNFMEEHEPQSIIPAEERFVSDGKGGRWEPVPMETRTVGTIYSLKHGKSKAYYVPRPIAEMFNHGSPLESQIIGLAHKTLAWPKAILTELNPGFWPVAFAKDVVGAAVQLPKGMRMLKQVPSSWAAARASMLSRPSPIADAALRRLMVISRADNRGEHLGHADELTRVLMRMGQQPQLWDAEAKKIGTVLRFWQAWKRQGQVLERTMKIASMQHLDEAFPDMPEWEKKRIVNEQGGSPDFLEKGRAAPLVDFWMMFYNPWLRGLEAMKTSAQRDPRGYWTRFLGTIGLAGAAYWMFEQGLLGEGEEAEETRDMLRSIPERDKRRGFAIPLGWADKAQGKVAYVVLPFPDTVRMIYVAQRSALQTMSGDRPPAAGLGEVISYQGQDLPGMNPMLEEAGKWWDYHVLGRNPYDNFTGRGVLEEDMVTARQGGTELALESLSNVTGGMIYRHRPQRPGDTPTDLEKFLRLPVVSNLLGRWVRVSSRGFDEQMERDVAAVRQREAELRLVADEIVGREMRGEPWSESQTQLFMEEPYLAQRVIDRQITLMQQATAPEMRAWERAKSIGERVALLEAWAKRAEEREARLSRQ